jgi:hypothetical protein
MPLSNLKLLLIDQKVSACQHHYLPQNHWILESLGELVQTCVQHCILAVRVLERLKYGRIALQKFQYMFDLKAIKSTLYNRSTYLQPTTHYLILIVDLVLIWKYVDIQCSEYY